MKKMTRHFGAACVIGMTIALSAGSALAGSVKEQVAAVRKQAVASMVLSGEITIDEQGKVASHTIDKPGELPAGVLRLLDQTVPHWRFEPVLVDGVARPARSPMRLRVVAREQGNGDYAVSLQDVVFPGEEPVPGSFATGEKMVPPRYPEGALRRGATGIVYVVVRVGPDGRVEDAVAEQVNLPFVATERVMEAYRKLFADASVRAAKASTFNPPTVGENVGKSTSVRVPYDFHMGSTKEPVYGQWTSYVPGPYRPAPWRVGELQGSPDLLATGTGTQPLAEENGLRLLTSLGAGL